MAFKKLYKVVADSPVGFQTMNQAGLNLDEHRTQMYVEHGSNEPQVGGVGGTPFLLDYAKLGRHNLEEIPRAVGVSYLAPQPNLTYSAQLGWTGPGVPWIWKWSTGFYYLPVIGLSQWFAVPTVHAGASVTYLPPQMRPFYASATNGGNSGIWVSTFALDTGDFVPVDTGFSFALYGTP